MKTKDIKNAVRMVSNWPKEGVNFVDISTVLESAKLFKEIINKMARMIKAKEIDKIVGIDARGFIFASALAYKLNKGLVMARKKGKLPANTISVSYGLEYGSSAVELHRDSILPGEKVMVVDDVLATGGTAKAVLGLVEELGGEVAGLLFFAEILELKGRNKFNGANVDSLLKY
jgi:adenine phosphoribosyltransferase